MKHLFLAVFLTTLANSISAQVGFSTEEPDKAAELHIVSENNNTGVLIPSLTSAQITNTTKFPNPAHGLLIYNETEKTFMYNAGTTTDPLWTYVGQIPAVADISSTTCSQKGDMRYCKTSKKMYYCNGTNWTALKSL